MRCTQIQGLNDWARGAVEGELVFAYTERVTRVFPDGREEQLPDKPIDVPSVKREPTGKSFSSWYDEEYPLHRYIFPDGRVYTESVQASVDSSGPVIFLALQDEQGQWIPESLWEEAEIEAA